MLEDSNRKRTRELGSEFKERLPDGRWWVTWETNKPRLYEVSLTTMLCVAAFFLTLSVFLLVGYAADKQQLLIPAPNQLRFLSAY